MIFSFQYALRQIISPRKKFLTNKRVLGALIGMILSLIPVMVVMVVVDGMIDGISDRFLALGDSHIKVYSYSARTEEEIADAVENSKEQDQILSAVQSVNGRGLLFNPQTKFKTGVDIKGFPPNVQELDEGFKKYIEVIEGEFSLEDPKDIMVSSAAAKQLGIHAGEEVDLLMVVTLGGRERPIKGRYHVKGIFSTGYYQLDNVSIYMNFDRIYPLFREKGVQIYLKVEDPYDDIFEVTQELRDSVNENSYWQVTHWQANNRTFFNSLEDTRFLIMLVMLGIVIITSFNIMSTFFMIVKEKESEIAILKSCGVPTSVITSSFVFSGFILAVIGTGLGILLGLVMAVNINGILNLIESLINFFLNFDGKSFQILSSDYYLEKIPVYIDGVKVLIISFFSIFIAFLFTLFPSLKVIKVKPIETIRKH